MLKNLDLRISQCSLGRLKDICGPWWGGGGAGKWQSLDPMALTLVLAQEQLPYPFMRQVVSHVLSDRSPSLACVSCEASSRC